MRVVCCVALIALGGLGCTYDFASFEEPGQGDAAGDSSAGDSSSSNDSAAIDSGGGSDTSTPPSDTGAPPDTSTPPDTSVVDTGAMDTGVPCTDPGGALYAGHCYFPITANRWSNVRTTCTAKGAHLVTITSSGEEAFVEAIHPTVPRWIGLSRPAVAAPWAWVTGEPVGFTKWGAGEPSGIGTCAAMRTSNDWGADDCKQSYEAICERE